MKKSLSLVMVLITIIMFTACNPKVGTTTQQISSATKYKYTTVPGDPLNVKRYTLDNGLQVIMSVNKAKPRIMTNIAVRAGSKHDPADATGLAHYLEHMMFKGTPNLGSLDWEKEKVLLQQISDLYEKHRQTTDPAKRKEIYAEIDKVSNEAAKLVAASEYDKTVTSLGAKGTNAYTYVEQTVYVNDIPSNELDKWLELESERFQHLVLRLFHTELEAVYEEFNIGQDNDSRKSNKALTQMLFPDHPYGTQSTIGKGEHLKNPSHVKIHEYFNKYYVPNNMAIVLAGDLNPDETVDKVKKYFGEYKRKEVNRPTFNGESDLSERREREVLGQKDPFIDIAWKIDGGVANRDAALKLELISRVLNNGKAGLIDINLNQKQKILEGDSWLWKFEDYNVFGLYGKPRAGQSLKEVEQLLMTELQNLKDGKFEEWLLDATIKNLKLSEIRAAESNNARVYAMTNAFITGLNWNDRVSRLDDLSKITKQELIDFAKKHLRLDNHAIVYKKTGEDKSVMKVEKPTITPVSLNRTKASPYFTQLKNKQSASLAPAFLDFANIVETEKLQEGVTLDYMKNEDNELFTLLYILEMGKNHDKKLPIAVNYLKYLGTDKYSAEELQQEFFKLGLNFNVFSGDERVYVSLNGLKESMEEGVKLFEHILANAKGDEAALENVKADLLLRRKNLKKNKNMILRAGMRNYGIYGQNSAFRDNLPEAALKATTSDELIEKVKGLTSYEHKVFYYGTKSKSEVANILKKYHTVPSSLKSIPEGKKYAQVGGVKNEVLFVEFPMVQAEVMLLSKGTENFNLEEYVISELYNSYFGFGLSSIMFQEIRESRALAYSTYAYSGAPSKQDEAHYFMAYVGTQANKLKDAVTAVKEIVNDMPYSEEQINAAKVSILKKIETERINGSDKYWKARSAKERGYNRDLRQDVYNAVKAATPADVKAYQEKFIKDRKYTVLVLGEKKNIGKEGMEYLKTLGDIKEITLEELFGY